MTFLKNQVEPGGIVHELIVSGFSGVTLFFILSGIVLSLGYHDSIKNFGDVTKFYFGRFSRIVPLWLLVSLPIFLSRDFGGVGFLPYVTFTQAWYDNPQVAFSFIAVAWTLSVEMFFYLLFPALLLISQYLHRFALAGWVFVGVGALIPTASAAAFAFEFEPFTRLLSGTGSHYYALYHLPLIRIGDFILGIGIYFFAIEHKFLRRFWLLFVAAGLILTGIAVAITNEGIWAWDAVWILPFATLLFGLLVAPRRLTEKTPQGLVILGESSFALYLIHQYYIIPYFGGWGLALTGSLPAASIIVVLVAIFCSVGIFVSFEKPVMKLLRRGWSSAADRIGRVATR